MDTPISQSVARFQHDDLPDAARYIRLLEVLNEDSSEGVKVHCRITTWPIASVPSYHAISYTWEDSESNTTILINGEAFQVRKKCEFVLKQAYWFEKTNYYWVDSICINQQNLEEKSMQVSIMGSIFKEASHVLACVGDHADDSILLFARLKLRPFTAQYYGASSLMTISKRFKLRQRFTTNVRFFHAVFCFIHRPYFTRLWILQELRNAQHATFLCGSDAIPKSVMSDMCVAVLQNSRFMPNIPPKFPLVLTRTATRLWFFRRLWAGEACWWNFVHALNLEQGRSQADRIFDNILRAHLVVSPDGDVMTVNAAAASLECQERKDRVFGVISLIGWGDLAPLGPDYTQTEFEVAVSFLQALLNAWRHQRGTFVLEVMIWIPSKVVSMLDLDTNSNGVPKALQSRRLERGRICERGLDDMAVEFTHSRHEVSTGWRVSNEHLAKDDSGFSTWSSSPPGRWKVYLPLWAKGGDWIVSIGPHPPYNRYVLVREATEGLGGPIIGYVGAGLGDAFQYEIWPARADSIHFGIHWNAEDLVPYDILEKEGYFHLEVKRFSTDWVTALNTAVCDNQAPGSSYAFRCDGTRCQTVPNS